MWAVIFSRWRLVAGLTGAIALAGYIGVLNVQLASERVTVAMLDADLRTAQGQVAQCSARLENILERIKSDASVPDDLGGFVPPDDWFLPADPAD